MICADFKCPSGHITEHLCHGKQKKVICPECGKNAKRIITAGKVNLVNESPEWLKSVLDVVDKDSTKPHVREFVKNPTRQTYHKWMKGEGIRPADHTEHGGPPTYHPPQEPDMTRAMKEVARQHFERKKIEL
jgi:hypothetical protein